MITSVGPKQTAGTIVKRCSQRWLWVTAENNCLAARWKLQSYSLWLWRLTSGHFKVITYIFCLVDLDLGKAIIPHKEI